MSILVETREREFEYIQDIPPVNPKIGTTWKNTSFDPPKFRIFNGSIWHDIIEPYTLLRADFTVDDDTAVINQTIQFTDTSTSNVNLISWQWDFGDGTTSTDQNPTHAYTANGQYTVSLVVIDSSHAEDTKIKTNFITVANDPGANFTANFTAQHVNTTVSFTDQSTSNGTITSWQWNFGDGTTSTEQNPQHQYSSSGLYTVSLTVTDEYGSDTMTRNNYIAIDMPPTAEFVSNIQSAYIHDNIQFTDQSTSYGTITSWQWDFGDGNTTTVQNPVYSYAATGNYTITLTVTDEFGSDTQIKTDYITISAHGTGYEYGYTMGGHGGSNNLSTIDRIIFPFDSGTAIHVGNLSSVRRENGGCNSSNYGYAMGGNISDYLSIIDRITFPFDSGTATHVGNLSSAKTWVIGCNSSNYGYCMGGNGESNYSTIDRIIFPFDSGTATHVGNLSSARRDGAACNSSNYGYAIDGYNTPNKTNFSTIDRITFPFDSGIATHVGNLSSARRENSGGNNSSNYGYCIGGNNGNLYISTIDRITFPFDSGIATHVGNLSSARRENGGCNSTNYGYSMGGYNNNLNHISTIDRIIFPFDSGTATHVGNLSGSKGAAAGCDGTDFVTLFI